MPQGGNSMPAVVLPFPGATYAGWNAKGWAISPTVVKPADKNQQVASAGMLLAVDSMADLPAAHAPPEQ